MKYSTKLTLLLLAGMCLISGVALSAPTWQKVATGNNCNAAGQVCTDGSIYIGNGFYAHPTDAPTTLQYASTNIAHPYSASFVDGKKNTYAACQSRSDPSYAESPVTTGCTSALPAMAYCYNSTALGRTDWYLPSHSELIVLLGSVLTNNTVLSSAAAGSLPSGVLWSTANPVYWSSTSVSTSSLDALTYYRGSSYHTSYYKNNAYAVRCVRRDSIPLQ